MTLPEQRADKSQRDDLVDALKFVAIAMVVLTHVLNLRWEFKHLAPWLVELMMAFNMPLFIFLSGYLLFGREGKSPIAYLKAKALALLVPYFAWIAIELPLRKVPVPQWLPRLARAAIDPLASFQMWFLLVLFVALVLFYLVHRLAGGPWAVLLSGVVVALIPLLELSRFNLITRLCWLYPFLALGYFMAARKRVIAPPLRSGIGAVSVAGFPLLFATGWDGVGYRLAIGTLGIAAAWSMARLAGPQVQRVLAWGGRRTLGVYGWQMVALPFLIVGSGWFGALASWLIVICAALALTTALEQTPVTRAVFLGSWPRTSRSQVPASS